MKKQMCLGAMLSLVASSMLLAETFELGKIEVTSEKDISANPSVEVVTSETIKETDAKTVVDALQSTPGVYADYAGARGESKVRVRGFSSNRVPIYVDGIPIYVPYDHNIDLGRFKTYDIGEIDVSKGYVSPMYGANTMGGAINLITKQPTKELEGEVGVGAFSGDGYEEYATMGTKQELYYGLISVSNVSRDYYKISSDYDPAGHQEGHKRSNSESGDKKLNLKVGYTPNSTDEYSFNYIVQRGDKEQPWYASAQGSTGGGVYNRNWDWKDWDKTSYYIITKTAIGEHFLKTRWYYDEFYNKILFKGTPQTSAQNTVTEISEYDDNTFGGIIEGDIKIADNHLLKLSVSQKYDNHKDISSKSSGADLKDESKTLSLGAEYSWQMSDKLTWTLGGSYDQNEVTKAEYRNNAGTRIAGEFPKYDSDAFNPQTILSYQATKDLMFYGSVSQKSNMPTLKDRYSSRFGDYILNPDLDAEQSTTYEIGTDWAFVEDQHAKVALFYTKTKDYIASVSGLTNTNPALGCTGTNCKQMQNFDQEEHKGAEVSLNSQWNEQLRSTLSYTYIDATIEDSKTANAKYTIDTPKHSYYASLTYSPIHSVDITPIVRHEGKRYSNVSGSEESSSYTVADIRVAYRPIKDLELAVGIKNLFDEYYYYNNGYAQEGRNYYANARYSF
ncbi:TonB-dependent receptor [Sulfurospirillum cavolei]|uniref:TonB-dependent receptor n=1 Tax=Sulfurospirillum cavolei TaxID=366522 RepID=UPI003FA21622